MECNSCKFWWPYKGGNVSSRKETRRESATKGECRRYPTTDHSGDVGRFPATKPDQWCGEYKSD